MPSDSNGSIAGNRHYSIGTIEGPLVKALADRTKHATLQQERKTIEKLEYGVREAIRMKKTVTAALFLAGELEDKFIEEGGFDKNKVHATLKDLKPLYGAKHGEQEYHGWQL